MDEYLRNMLESLGPIVTFLMLPANLRKIETLTRGHHFLYIKLDRTAYTGSLPVTAWMSMCLRNFFQATSTRATGWTATSTVPFPKGPRTQIMGF